MACVDCANWALKGSALAQAGMGNCQHLPRYTYVAKGCSRIKPAESAVVEARVAWLNKNFPISGHKKA